METFKLFTTNVRNLGEISHVEYTVYTIRTEDEPESNLIRDLRRLGILCSVVGAKFWVFGPRDSPSKRIATWHGAGLVVSEQGTLEDHVSSPSVETISPKDVFLEALEAGITFDLGRDQVYRAGPWMWLFLASTFDEATSHCTTLQFETKEPHRVVPQFAVVVKQSFLRSCTKPSEKIACEVLVAPSGASARILPKTEISPDIRLVDGDSWRSRVTQTLQQQGIDIDPSEEWISLSLQDGLDLRYFTWPARLCFSRQCPRSQYEMHLDDSQGWRRWFGLEGTSNLDDPLAFTANWYSHSLANGKQSHDLDSVMQYYDCATAENVEQPVFTPDVISQLQTSPSSHQILTGSHGALDGIYPTPPDGIIQGPATQQTTSDSLGIAMPGDSSGLGIDGATGSDDSHARDRSLNSSAGPPEYRPIPDDLFEDMNEMDFVDNEVGDADFDYFDEPDETPLPGTQDEIEPTANALEEGMVERNESVEQRDVEMSLELENSSEQRDHRETDTDSGPQDLAHAQRDTIQISGIDGDDPVDTLATVETPHDGEQTVADTLSGEVQHAQPEDEITFAKANGSLESGPLSPFGIRERLLPVPVPASLTQTESQRRTQGRQGSLFAPLTFNEALSLKAKYNVNRSDEISSHHAGTTKGPNEPQIKGKLANWSPTRGSPIRSSVTLLDDAYSSESDEDSSDDLTPMERSDHLPTSPWETWKRKHSLLSEAVPRPQSVDVQLQLDVIDEEEVSEILHILEFSSSSISRVHQFSNELDLPDRSEEIELTELTSVLSVQELFGLNNDDMVCIAQVISEQSIGGISAVHNVLATRECLSAGLHSTSEALIRDAVEHVLQQYLPDISNRDTSSLALVREAARPTMGHSKNASTGWSGLPRANQRSDSKQLVPDYFNLPSPYVRVKRGADTWEMLPPALRFWSALSLGTSQRRERCGDNKHCPIP